MYQPVLGQFLTRLFFDLLNSMGRHQVHSAIGSKLLNVEVQHVAYFTGGVDAIPARLERDAAYCFTDGCWEHSPFDPGEIPATETEALLRLVTRIEIDTSVIDAPVITLHFAVTAKHVFDTMTFFPERLLPRRRVKYWDKFDNRSPLDMDAVRREADMNAPTEPPP